ncbi:metallophosphoesterase [Halalkalibaculum sp. DA3122]|uniref:metallophosphoesterase n=1 Tax=Halalkalibaculum sp. DA3122 TaxID=3373607 RepID=UPI0037547F10
MPWLLKMTLLAATIKAAVDLYLGWRMIRAVEYLSPTSGSSLAWLVVLLFLTFYLFPLSGFFQYLGGADVDILTYPKPIIYYFWFGLAFSFQVLAWIVASDILKISANANGINAPFVDQIYGFLVVGFFLVILVYTGYKMYSDTLDIEVEPITYTEETLSEDLEGFRIAHITDVQADRYTGQPQVAAYVDRVNAEHPDLVVVTGDLISYGTEYVAMAADELARLEAPHGVYFVIGDHDYWAGSDEIAGALRERGIRVLEGENAYREVGRARVRLSGITNVYSRTAPVEEVRRLTRDSTEAELRVMLTHQVSEEIIRESEAAGYHLLLAGHTHGGQIRVPLFFTRFSAPDFETPYVQGQYQEGEMLINVNNGLGFTLSPVRYNAPPNISIIELRRE